MPNDLIASYKSILRRLLPRVIRDQRILAGPLHGYRIVTSWHDYPAAITGRTETTLLDWFGKNVKFGETWLDVGAHYGYTSIALSHLVGATGRVFAFEPMISTAGCVTQTRQLNNLPQLIVLPIGLAYPETLEMVELPVTRGMVDRTLGMGEEKRAGSTREKRMKVIRGRALRERIMAARLDWLWPRVCGKSEKIDGIKIDVQGMELETLQGMIGILSRWKPRLVVEFHVGVERSALLSVIESAGYVRRGEPIEPIAGEIEPQYTDNLSYTFIPSDVAEDNTPNL